MSVCIHGRRRREDKRISRLELSTCAAAVIRRHAEAVYPDEACGGLLGNSASSGDSWAAKALPVENLHALESGCRYLIGGADVLSLERSARALGLTVVGYYHSHPDAPAIPSEIDREHAWPWYVYLIMSVSRGACVRSRAWRLKGDRQAFAPIEVDVAGRAEE